MPKRRACHSNVHTLLFKAASCKACSGIPQARCCHQYCFLTENRGHCIMRQPPKESSQSLSYHIALGGIIAALCIACMFLTGVFPMFYLILPMLASAFIYIMTLETGGYWGFLTYLSVGLLSVLSRRTRTLHWHSCSFSAIFPCCETAWNGSAGSFSGSCSGWQSLMPQC